MKLAFEIIFLLVASINLLLTWFVLFRLHQPATIFLWLIKVFVSADAPILFLVGLLCAIFSLFLNSLPVGAIGTLSAFLYLWYIIRVTRAPDSATGFEKAFGAHWKDRIPPERKSLFLSKRYTVKLPDGREPVFIQNISFHTIPDTNRQLLCDIWQPPVNMKPSGLAFIYLHGSAWTALDKDFGTRTFFRHFANQGHVIMDVAYRLFPEADFMGMLYDTKHAIAWMKASAGAYGVNPDKIVIGGGSAGAHLAMLAAYTARNKQLTPPALDTSDLSVHGVISLYGQANLAATYYHTCQHLVSHSALGKKKKGSGGMPSWIQNCMGDDFHRLGFDKDVEPGMLVPILGGNPEEKPDAYSLFSPITFVSKDCPATLILHGEHDILAPVKEIQKMCSQLKEAGVPVVMHILPQTDHAFDLILSKISPSSHNAFYDVERFLACMLLESRN